MYFLARNSRATGPKMRVPIGSPCGLTRTAEFWSKRRKLPSARPISFTVRRLSEREELASLSERERAEPPGSALGRNG